MRSSRSVRVGKIVRTSSFAATYSPHCTGTPISFRLSSRRTLRPRRAAYRAAVPPAGPEPTTTTSYAIRAPCPLDVAREDVVHEPEEVPLRLRVGELVEGFLSQGPEGPRVDPCLLHRARLLDHPEGLADLRLVLPALADDPRELRVINRRAVVEGVDRDEGHVSLLDVRPRGLPEAGAVSNHVEDVVHDLEGDAEVEPVLPDRVHELEARPREEAGDLRAGHDREGRLPADDVEVFVPVHVDVVRVALLADLPLREGRARVRRELDGRREVDGLADVLSPEGLEREEGHEGPDSLPARADDVGRDVREEGLVGDDALADLPFHEGEFFPHPEVQGRRHPEGLRAVLWSGVI